MFHRVTKYVRPLAVRASCARNFCSKRNIPVIQVRSPWRQSRPWDDFFSFPRRNWIQEVERDFEDFWRRAAKDSDFFLSPTSRATGTQVKYDSSVFEVKLDVSNFKPEEMEIKLAKNRLIISGKHEQKADEHGFVRREFQREFEIPKDVDMESMKSTISEEGILTIRADVEAPVKQPDKVIEIKRETKEVDAEKEGQEKVTS